MFHRLYRYFLTSQVQVYYSILTIWCTYFWETYYGLKQLVPVLSNLPESDSNRVCCLSVLPVGASVDMLVSSLHTCVFVQWFCMYCCPKHNVKKILCITLEFVLTAEKDKNYNCSMRKTLVDPTYRNNVGYYWSLGNL